MHKGAAVICCEHAVIFFLHYLFVTLEGKRGVDFYVSIGSRRWIVLYRSAFVFLIFLVRCVDCGRGSATCCDLVASSLHFLIARALCFIFVISLIGIPLNTFPKWMEFRFFISPDLFL